MTKRVVAVSLMIWAMVILLSIIGTAYSTSSMATLRSDGMPQQDQGFFVFHAFDTNPFQDFVEVSRSVTGYLDRVTVVTAGTDTSFKVYVKDCHNKVIFSKTDCSTANAPYGYPLAEADTLGNLVPGIPINGPVTVQVDDADDESMTQVDVYVYGYEYWQ